MLELSILISLLLFIAKVTIYPSLAAVLIATPIIVAILWPLIILVFVAAWTALLGAVVFVPFYLLSLIGDAKAKFKRKKK